MRFDPARFKRDFPLFQHPENHGLVYLDNAATTQRPAAVIKGLTDFYLQHNANAHRASHRLARAATAMLEDCRQAAAQFLGAAQASEIVFCRGATEALNLLAYSLCSGFSAGDEIVLSEAEHHANLVPWQLAAQRHGLVLRFLPPRDGAPDTSQLAALINPRTRLVSITAASNALGAVTDLSGVAALLAGQDVPWILDAAQLAAHAPLDVQALGCDFLVCSAHKFYGPTGVGLLYGRASRLAALPPWQAGGEMIRTVGLFSSEFAAPPQRFETGTAPLAAIAGLRACFDFLAGQDRAAMRTHETALIHYLHQQLQALPGLLLLSSPDHNLGIANFVLAPDTGLHESDLAAWLDARDIALRLGRHCAQPLMDRVAGRPSLRASIAGYTDRDDIDRLVAAIDEALRGASCTARRVEQAGAFDALEGVSLTALCALPGWQKKQKQLMQWAQQISTKPDLRIERYRVDGCESATWIAHQKIDGRHRFRIDSDARLVRGLAALLLSLIDDRDDAALAALDTEAAFEAAGLARHLSVSRVNGFRAALERALTLIRA